MALPLHTLGASMPGKQHVGHFNELLITEGLVAKGRGWLDRKET